MPFLDIRRLVAIGGDRGSLSMGITSHLAAI